MFLVVINEEAVNQIKVHKLTKIQEENVRKIWHDDDLVPSLNDREGQFLEREFGINDRWSCYFLDSESVSIGFANTTFKEVSLPNQTVTFQ